MGWHVLGWEKDLNEIAPWQVDIINPLHQQKLTNMLFQAARDADVVILQMVHTEFALATMYALRDQFPGKHILAECDDNVFDVATYNQASDVYRPGSGLTRITIEQFKESDGLIVSTPYLKDLYSDTQKNIWVCQNSVDVKRWASLKRTKKRGIRIGWAGGSSHSDDLQTIEPVIRNIVKRYPQARFVFKSSDLPDFLKIDGVECVAKWSDVMSYPKAMASLGLDIGIAPLRDNAFNRGKSNLKWLEYSALGIPTVASNVGHFAQTVINGEDGLLADGPEEFEAHLSKLIEDRSYRTRMGRAAFHRVEQDFNVDKNIYHYRDCLREALTLKAKPAPSLYSGIETEEIKALPMGEA
jgi:glycosyltransferase involved in cell wall biosynthesis